MVLCEWDCLKLSAELNQRNVTLYPQYLWSLSRRFVDLLIQNVERLPPPGICPEPNLNLTLTLIT